MLADSFETTGHIKSVNSVIYHRKTPMSPMPIVTLRAEKTEFHEPVR